MTRETRANLIFLVIFLAISLPGAVILFKKKLDPAERAMYLPEPVRHQIPYMAPYMAADHVQRVVPEKTAAFVRLITESPEQTPVGQISEARSFEVIQTQIIPGQPLKVLIWDQRIDLERPVLIEVGTGSDKLGPVRARVTPISLEASIRRELQDLGYVRPPEQVVMALADFPQQGDPVSLSYIRVQWSDGRRDHEDRYTP